MTLRTEFESLWAQLEPQGRSASSGGYRRFAWTSVDLDLRAWFVAEAARRGLDVVVDRAGNQWAWWGDPDAAFTRGEPGVAMGSHLDSVPDGGAFDGPLGVVSAFLALDVLRAEGFIPSRPIGIVNFSDEEGARFGIACAGSRLLTGALDPARALGLVDADGVTLETAMGAAGLDTHFVGRDDETLRRVGAFIELHVEQGRALIDLDAPVGIASAIWPHGRWRFTFDGEANHAGTTRIEDRHDPMITYAEAVLAARAAAQRHGALATFGKVQVLPNGVNAIPSRVSAWLDLRGPEQVLLDAVLEDLVMPGVVVENESLTPLTVFDAELRDVITAEWERDGDTIPALPTGAGHDAGILANEGVPTAMLFVRNPTGISHSPKEFSETDDCVSGIESLAQVIRALTS
jgi:N-carbamoyl-L-amino-acid hydrolase